jgi:Ran GTPase-activating protein (RanGAP) involved in mRNA processing and transport
MCSGGLTLLKSLQLQTCSLRDLKMDGNNFSQFGTSSMGKITEALLKTKIEVLSMQNCQLKNEPVIAILNTLHTNSIKSLNLSKNQCDVALCSEVSEMLKLKTNLHTLNLARNQL